MPEPRATPRRDFNMETRSISDDDLCSDCARCTYNPGENSGCKVNWPGETDPDGYIISCAQFEKVKARGDNIELR